MSQLKNKIIVFFTFIGGLYFFLEYILPEKWQLIGYEIEFGKYHDQITQGVIILSLMTIGLGIINIFMTHGAIILKSRPHWINSLVLLLSFLITAFYLTSDFIAQEKKNYTIARFENLELFVKTVVEDYETKQSAPLPRLQALIISLEKERSPELNAAINSSISETKILMRELEVNNAVKNNLHSQKEILIVALQGLTKQVARLAQINYEKDKAQLVSSFIKNSLFIPLGSAMFSLLAFYVVTAAYRSFRIKSWEALAIMIPALLIMLGQIPHGPAYIYSGLPDIRTWLLKNLSSPAFRAIFFGSAIAGLAMAVRMWLSLEKSPVQDDEQDRG
ncbi:MAG: hypothetical protein LBE20_01935 [Deltaproteobacteria bacterium]|jgi:hypothetical protein|nr:hypothetical protein [Deltaproteobacteria bacterium]